MISTLPPMPSQFEGNPGLMQGGYLAGVAAAGLDGPVRVQIRRPVHPGDVLSLDTTEQTKHLALLDDTTMMVAEIDPIRVIEPDSIDRQAAASALGVDLPFPKPFPMCVGCGDADHSLGLDIKPSEKRMIASWTPQPSHRGPDGEIDPLLVWTITDCFTSWALFADPPDQSAWPDTVGADSAAETSFVTGNIALDVRRPLQAGTTYLMQSWRDRILGPKGTDGGGSFRLGSLIVGGSIEDEHGIVALADQELVRTTGPGMSLAGFTSHRQ